MQGSVLSGAGNNRLIALFTDFGLEGPYVGQVKAVLHAQARGVPVVDLMADCPAFNAKSAAYLLAALAPYCPSGTVFVAVVDPGVGSDRKPCILETANQLFIGPDNGLFELLARHAGEQARFWEILWRPERMAPSFHGRDLFAPVAAALARGEAIQTLASPLTAPVRPDWPDNLDEIIYIDHYGNAMTGLRHVFLPISSHLIVKGRVLQYAATFSQVAPGEAFWYENANGLIEIAVNQGSAAQDFGLGVGTPVVVVGDGKRHA